MVCASETVFKRYEVYASAELVLAHREIAAKHLASVARGEKGTNYAQSLAALLSMEKDPERKDALLLLGENVLMGEYMDRNVTGLARARFCNLNWRAFSCWSQTNGCDTMFEFVPTLSASAGGAITWTPSAGPPPTPPLTIVGRALQKGAAAAAEASNAAAQRFVFDMIPHTMDELLHPGPQQAPSQANTLSTEPEPDLALEGGNDVAGGGGGGGRR